MTDKELDSLLKGAVYKLHQDELQKLPSDDTLKEMYHPLSDTFYAKMRTLLRAREKRHARFKILQNIAVFLFLIALLGLILGPFSGTSIAILPDFVFDNHSFRLDERVHTRELPHYPDFVLTYIPENFELVKEYTGPYVLHQHSESYEYQGVRYDFHYSTGSVAWGAHENVPQIIHEDGMVLYFLDTDVTDRAYLIWEINDLTLGLYTKRGDPEELFKMYHSIEMVWPDLMTPEEIEQELEKKKLEEEFEEPEEKPYPFPIPFPVQ